MPVLDRPLKDSRFTLDSSGVAGFFGGDEAISAMATVHLYEGRKWLGWYNSPGSYTIAKQFGQLANARVWDGLFPGPNETPAVSFKLDGRQGPKYVAALSGTEMQTGHLGYLIMESVKEEKDVERIPGRETSSGTIALLELNNVEYDNEVPKRSIDNALLAFIPITISFVGCVICAMVGDWYCFSMILLGIVSSGIACLLIGTAALTLKTVEKPAEGAPRGDGMLLGEDNTVVIVKGEEKDVNSITKGRFQLEISGGPRYNRIGFCSLLLLIQFLLQLLLIPQGSLFGQILFLGTLVVSWGYNSYLSSLEKEKIQAEILVKKLGNPRFHKFQLGTRTTMAVFACLLICCGTANKIDPEKILRVFVPNNTPVWQRWRNKVILQIEKNRVSSGEKLAYLELDEDDRKSVKEESDIKLLTTLLDDARSALNGYNAHFSTSRIK